jgi:hypothetical protein
MENRAIVPPQAVYEAAFAYTQCCKAIAYAICLLDASDKLDFAQVADGYPLLFGDFSY